MKIISPTYCTSVTCAPPKAYCDKCSHAIFCGEATLNGRVYRWEFNPRFGPLFNRTKDGSCNWCPHSRHKVWQAFQEWYELKFGKANAKNEGLTAQKGDL